MIVISWDETVWAYFTLQYHLLTGETNGKHETSGLVAGLVEFVVAVSTAGA